MINRKTKLVLAGLAGAAVIVGALLLGSGIGYASDKPIKRGDVCTNIGEERRDRSGDVYVCKQKPEDPCPRFHAKHPGRGGKPLPPCVCPSKSPSASASPSSSASPKPSTSTSPSKSATAAASSSLTPAGNTATLPVTGTPDVLRLLGVAFGLIGAGVLVLTVRAILIRRRTA